MWIEKTERSLLHENDNVNREYEAELYYVTQINKLIDLIVETKNKIISENAPKIYNVKKWQCFEQVRGWFLQRYDRAIPNHQYITFQAKVRNYE